MDVAYDFYSKRMATCSADHTIKVFDKVADTWQLSDSWRAHDAAVVKLSWAGPEYAQVIASASHDCVVKVWEEDTSETPGSGKRWKRKYTISDYGGPLYDIEFGSSYTGLKLASIASDGYLRIHEAMDPNNLGFWTQTAEIPLLNHPTARQLQSAFSLSWARSLALKDYLAVSVLEDAFIYCRNEAGKYVRVAELSQHKGLIRDMQWAPNLGRSYNMIATACKDGYLRLFKVTRVPGNGEEQTLNIDLVHESADHNGEVWRVAWNLTGTVLSSTGDDGKIRFWKSTYTGQFQNAAVVTSEQRQREGAVQI